jgi:hypothetical protein
MWKEQPDAVEKAMKSILQVETLDPASKPYFDNRSVAAAQAYNNLTTQEKLEILNLKEKYKQVAKELEIQ